MTKIVVSLEVVDNVVVVEQNPSKRSWISDV